MPATHVTSGDEALDLICHRHYGAVAGAVEQVLAANPAIAPRAHALPAGTALHLPELESADIAAQMRSLWD